MGFVDKIKNALFEEVEEEVEEKPKKEKVKKGSVRDKLIKREKEEREKKEQEKEKKEKPIAKKVILDDTLDERVDYHELRDEDFDIEPLTDDSTERVKSSDVSVPSFTVIDESDLIVDDYKEEKPLITEVVEKKEEVKEEKKVEEPVEEFNYYEEAQTKPYGIDKDTIKMHEYGTISRQEEKAIFRPSPIISPIYGILDKNYKKEDIVNKKDVHITSSYERRNLSVDDVRKKAYGNSSNDISEDVDKELAKEEKKDNLLVDLTDDTKKPEVDKITMGDAEEYFEDLGLEYNVDYVDAQKEEAKKETKVEEKEEKEEKKEEVKEKPRRREKENYEEEVQEEVKEEKTEDTNVDDDDDNLFDLIDSMYQEKE